MKLLTPKLSLSYILFWLFWAGITLNLIDSGVMLLLKTSLVTHTWGSCNLGVFWNTGAALDLFSSTSPYIHILVNCLAISICIHFIKTGKYYQALFLITAGGVSNLIHRIMYFAVPDLLSCQLPVLHWQTPWVNSGDLAIMLGLILGVFTYIKYWLFKQKSN